MTNQNKLLDLSRKMLMLWEDCELHRSGNPSEDFLKASRLYWDLESEMKDGFLVESTAYGEKLDGKWGVTGVLIARLSPHEINSLMGKGEKVRFL